MYVLRSTGCLEVERVIVRVVHRVRDYSCVVCVVMDVEYSNGVVEWVWENMILEGVSDSVLPHLGVPDYSGGEVAGVLGDICACGGGML